MALNDVLEEEKHLLKELDRLDALLGETKSRLEKLQRDKVRQEKDDLINKLESARPGSTVGIDNALFVKIYDDYWNIYSVRHGTPQCHSFAKSFYVAGELLEAMRAEGTDRWETVLSLADGPGFVTEKG